MYKMKDFTFCFTSLVFIFAVIFFSETETPATPAGVGGQVADYIIDRPLSTHYASACSYYGVLIFSEAAGDIELKDQVIINYQPYLDTSNWPSPGHVDWNVFGIVPFELYRQTANEDYLPLAVYLADTEFDNPRSDGLSPYTRFWVDDLYMVGSLQAQAYKSTLDINYINNGVTQLLGYIEEVEDLQQPNGLFHHSYRAPFFWGRGNGWAAASMTETLLAMPQDHPKRDQLLAAYQRMMDGLLLYQDSSGLWFQVMNMPDDPRNWLETSGTGMFVFALATGVEQGWLSGSQYRQAAADGWLGLENYVNSSGAVREVCVGTGQGSNVEHYFNRPRDVGDAHGQAGVIWAATAMVSSELIQKADFNIDGSVDFIDFAYFAEHWGASETTEAVRVREPADPCNHWALDEDSGVLVHDSSSSKKHGLNFGSLWAPTEGKFGGAALFGQTEADYIRVSTVKLSASEGTISVWVNLAPDPQPDRVRYIFGHSASGSYSNRIQLYMDVYDRELDLGLGDSHTRATGIQTLMPETWYHIVLTWDHGDYVVYVDGLAEATGTYTGLSDPLTTMADVGNNGLLHDQSFYGLIDEVCFYDYALSDAEAAYLAGITERTLPMPQESIPFDLSKDNMINSGDLITFTEMWLTGK